MWKTKYLKLWIVTTQENESTTFFRSKDIWWCKWLKLPLTMCRPPRPALERATTGFLLMCATAHDQRHLYKCYVSQRWPPSLKPPPEDWLRHSQVTARSLNTKFRCKNKRTASSPCLQVKPALIRPLLVSRGASSCWTSEKQLKSFWNHGAHLQQPSCSNTCRPESILQCLTSSKVPSHWTVCAPLCTTIHHLRSWDRRANCGLPTLPSVPSVSETSQTLLYPVT